MIKSYKDKRLKQLQCKGDGKGFSSNLIKKIRVKLEQIDSANSISDLSIPGNGLHELKGDRKGTWAIKVTENWRITFEFRDGNAYSVNYEDYH